MNLKPGISFKTIVSLFVARNKEFYRDRGSVTWAILFPLLIITGITFAFKNQDQELFKIGVLDLPQQMSQIDLLKKPWIKVVNYNEKNLTETMAFERVRHHQLDLLLKENEGHIIYWINPTSSRGEAIEKLLLAETINEPLEKQIITGRPIRYVDWVIPGILGMNIMFGALFGIGYVIVRYRKMEVLKRMQATPVSALEYLSAQVISRLFIIISISAAIFTICNMALNFMVEGSYLLLFCVAVIGGFAMITLGLMIASRTDNEELAGGLLNFATFPMMFFSEVWFSLDGAPQWMHTLSQALPLTHIVAAARQIMLEGAGLEEISPHLLVLGCMSIVLLLVSAKLFRWSKS